MIHNLFRFLTENAMISSGDHIICAVSGGKDSMAMLHGLLALKKRLGITLSVAHVNHSLRGDESSRDEAFVVSHCQALGLPVHRKKLNVSEYAWENKLGLEEAARILRYDYLTSIDPSAKIATAHTADDNLETLLMHLIRGTGLRGLGGIPPIRENIIRPMLSCTRDQIQAFLSENAIPHVEDSTNQTDFCLRNRIRHHVIPLLIAENPSVSHLCSELCIALRQDHDYLQSSAEELFQEVYQGSGLSCQKLLGIPQNMALRVLERYLRDVPELQRDHLIAALRLSAHHAPSGRLSLPGGFILRREYDLMTLDPMERSSSLPSITIKPGESRPFGPWHVTCGISSDASVPDGSIHLKQPCDGYFTLRTRLPGDRICLSGGTKKISRYMVDKKVPLYMRDMMPIVLSGDHIAAVLPLQADQNFKAKQGAGSWYLSATRLEEVKNET